MTNEEFERLKTSLREKLSRGESNAEAVDLENADAASKAARERRKLDRDMNRLERVLRKLTDAPKGTERQIAECERWNQFQKSFERRHAEIREIGARSDAKIKVMVEEMQKRNIRLS